MRAKLKLSKEQAEENQAYPLAGWWARLDSNQEPTDYESAALTVELRAPRFPYLTHSPQRCGARPACAGCQEDAQPVTTVTRHVPQRRRPRQRRRMIAQETFTRMKKLRFLLSLTNDDNDYQMEQTSAARHAP